MTRLRSSDDNFKTSTLQPWLVQQSILASPIEECPSDAHRSSSKSAQVLLLLDLHHICRLFYTSLLNSDDRYFINNVRVPKLVLLDERWNIKKRDMPMLICSSFPLYASSKSLPVQQLQWSPVWISFEGRFFDYPPPPPPIKLFNNRPRLSWYVKIRCAWRR